MGIRLNVLACVCGVASQVENRNSRRGFPCGKITCVCFGIILQIAGDRMFVQATGVV